MCSIGTLLAFVMVCLAVIVLRVTKPDAPRQFRVPWVPVVPILGALMCLAMMLALPLDTWIRLAVWLVIGLVIYFFLRAQEQQAPSSVTIRLPARLGRRPKRSPLGNCEGYQGWKTEPKYLRPDRREFPSPEAQGSRCSFPVGAGCRWKGKSVVVRGKDRSHLGDGQLRMIVVVVLQFRRGPDEGWHVSLDQALYRSIEGGVLMCLDRMLSQIQHRSVSFTTPMVWPGRSCGPAMCPRRLSTVMALVMLEVT